MDVVLMGIVQTNNPIISAHVEKDIRLYQIAWPVSVSSRFTSIYRRFSTSTY